MSEISVGDGILSPNAILNATNDLYTGWPKKSEATLYHYSFSLLSPTGWHMYSSHASTEACLTGWPNAQPQGWD